MSQRGEWGTGKGSHLPRNGESVLDPSPAPPAPLPDSRGRALTAWLRPEPSLLGQQMGVRRG